MRLNDRVASAKFPLGVWEYYITLKSSEFSANTNFTVTVTVTDNNSNTRTYTDTNSASLQITMIAEGASAYTHTEAWVDEDYSGGGSTVGDSDKPYTTIQAAITAAQTANGGDSSGNIIYLDEDADHTIPSFTANISGEWLTITKEDGANRDNVIINGGSSSIAGVKFDNITLQSPGGSQEIIIGNDIEIWTNSCRYIGSGRGTDRSNPVLISLQNPAKTGKYYSTDDYVYDVFEAYSTATLIRGADIEKVTDDAFKNHFFVVNATVTDLTNNAFYNHSDVLALDYETGLILLSNRLAYNVYATDCHYQGIMRSNNDVASVQDNAYINVFIEMRESGEAGNEGGNIQLKSSSNEIDDDHLLVWHCSFPYSNSTWYHDVTNSSFIGNLFFQETSTGSPQASTEWLHNHFMHYYGDGSSCQQTSKDLDATPQTVCPNPNASVKDTGSSTASTGSGVVDISDDTATDFGYPIVGSDLVDALPSTYVPADLFGVQRDNTPDIGALEYVNSGVSFGGSGSGSFGGAGSTTVGN